MTWKLPLLKSNDTGVVGGVSTVVVPQVGVMVRLAWVFEGLGRVSIDPPLVTCCT